MSDTDSIPFKVVGAHVSNILHFIDACKLGHRQFLDLGDVSEHTNDSLNAEQSPSLHQILDNLGELMDMILWKVDNATQERLRLVQTMATDILKISASLLQPSQGQLVSDAWETTMGECFIENELLILEQKLTMSKLNIGFAVSSLAL